MKQLSQPTQPETPAFDLLRAPVLGRFLRWRHARTILQTPLLLAAGLVIYDGLVGPQLAPRNFAGVGPWVVWRGLTVLALLLAGSLFCMACPFMLPRNIAKRFLPGDRPWPRRLQGKWLAVALLLLFFWSYEAFDLWASPWLTAWLAMAFFAGALVVDGVFRGAAFCKHVCPIGQFSFANSLCSPLEIKVRQPEVCWACTTKDCIMGRRAECSVDSAGKAVDARRQRQLDWGCELWLFQERKLGNLDCTFCLDCIHACPYDNVGVIARVPASEILDDRRRAGVGRLGERIDLAAMALVLVFAAFVNAFGMVGPYYDFERWVAVLLGGAGEELVLLVVLGTGLVALPAVAVGSAAWMSRALARTKEPLLPLATRYSYALVPLGFGMWLAHYGFHFLTGALTIVPVVQEFFADAGLPVLGVPRWGIGPLVPASWLLPAELVLLEMGLVGTLAVSYGVARGRSADGGVAARAFLPWAALALALFAAGAWLMLQPMEMRGTFKAG